MKMRLVLGSSYQEEIVENQQNSSGSSRRTETPVFNDSAEKNDLEHSDLEHSDSSDERELDDFTSLEYIGQEHRGPKKIKIHLKRNKSSGFGFRPVSAVAPEPIVTAVIEGSSAFRQGLKVGDRIRSVVVPGEIPTFHRTTSVTQIKEA
jgi:C-terminal processing protease CtpA/Prc